MSFKCHLQQVCCCRQGLLLPAFSQPATTAQALCHSLDGENRREEFSFSAITCLAHTYPAALLCVKCVNPCRQEAFFHYLFGVCDREDCWAALDLRTQRSFLFIPRCERCGMRCQAGKLWLLDLWLVLVVSVQNGGLPETAAVTHGWVPLAPERGPALPCFCRLPESYAVWMGHILSPEEVQVRACRFGCATRLAMLYSRHEPHPASSTSCHQRQLKWLFPAGAAGRMCTTPGSCRMHCHH